MHDLNAVLIVHAFIFLQFCPDDRLFPHQEDLRIHFGQRANASFDDRARCVIAAHGIYCYFHGQFLS